MKDDFPQRLFRLFKHLDEEFYHRNRVHIDLTLHVGPLVELYKTVAKLTAVAELFPLEMSHYPAGDVKRAHLIKKTPLKGITGKHLVQDPILVEKLNTLIEYVAKDYTSLKDNKPIDPDLAGDIRSFLEELRESIQQGPALA